MADIFSISTGLLGKLVASLLEGGDNVIEKAVLEKITELGKDVLSEIIKSTPVGAGLEAAESLERFNAAVESGGKTEFSRARNQWLNTIKKSFDGPDTGTNRLLGKVQKAFNDTAKEITRPEDGHWKWSKSRQEWLDENWRHDWRSQPRDRLGRWIPGRLNTIFIGRIKRKKRTARRKFARKTVKEMMRGD